jgi:FkbM family methyltransferase
VSGNDVSGNDVSGNPLECVIAGNALGEYCLPASSIHRPAARRILAGEVWEPDTVALVCRRLGRGDVVHAGTYFGDFLPAYSRACSPGAVVWAFEPNRENFRCAQITVKLNDLRNIRLANAALGAGRGDGAVITADPDGRARGGASQVVTGAAVRATSGAQPVSIVAVDDAVPPDRHVSVIQLDVEGFEETALSGALATIVRCRPVLVLETLPTGDWMARHLDPLAYRVVGTVHANTVLAAPDTTGGSSPAG